MKHLTFIILFITSIQGLLAQSPAEKVYNKVIADGPSTAPEFVVVTVTNYKTHESKEMCLTINELFDCLSLELKEDDSKKIKKYLLSKSADRKFILTNSEALKSIKFESYKSQKALEIEKGIDKLIINNHLIDSLSKIDTIRKRQDKLFNEYYNVRRKITNQISDSIIRKRPLDKKEQQVLSDLNDSYYDDREEQCCLLINDSNADKIDRGNIIKIWDSKINLYKGYKDQYTGINNELARCEKKFFRKYYNKYGITFCKALFKYGVICYFGDENPIVGFGGVLK
jgi:hypothetical protein